jgi:hypothetical protein
MSNTEFRIRKDSCLYFASPLRRAHFDTSTKLSAGRLSASRAGVAATAKQPRDGHPLSFSGFIYQRDEFGI